MKIPSNEPRVRPVGHLWHRRLYLTSVSWRFYVDGIVLKSNVLTGFPEPVDKFLTAIYAPFAWLLLRIASSAPP